MHGELPQFKRCCFCIPLRRGLIAWGYIRVAVDIINAVYLIIIISWLYQYIHDLSEFAYIFVMVAILFIDIAFTGLLVVGGHMKSARILRVSYIYGIVWLCLVSACAAYLNVLEFKRMVTFWEDAPMYKHMIMDLVIALAMEFIAIVVQVYVILLTRSEVIKLRNQSLEMQFVNHEADGEARCVRADAPPALTVVDEGD